MTRPAYVAAPWSPGLPGLVNALSHPSTGSPFATIQAAHDYVAALPNQGQLYIPAGEYGSSSLPAYTGLTIASNVRVFGDGQTCTFLDMDGQDPDLDCVEIEGSFASLEDIGVRGQAEDGLGMGVRFGNGGDPQRHSWVRRCTIEDAPGWGAYFEGDPGTDIVILSGLENVRILNPYTFGAAYVGHGCTTLSLLGCNMPVNPDSGPIVKIEGAEQCYIGGGSTFEPAGDAVCIEWATAADYIMGLTVENCYFELHDNNPAAYVWELTGATGQLIGGYFGKNIIKRYPEGISPDINQQVRLLRATGTQHPFRQMTLAHNRIYENRDGAAPTNDISIENNSHEIELVKNIVWSRTGALPRNLNCTGSTAGVLDWDYKRFQLPRVVTEIGYTTALLQGAMWRHITVGRSRQFTGAASQTITAVTEAEE